MVFTRRTILVIHSQQPTNQYAGGAASVDDSEQHWMRVLAREVVAELSTTGHDVRLGPAGSASSTFRDNVAWVQRPENRGADVLLSLHSNATARAGDQPVGIGVYHHPSSSHGEALAGSLMPYLKRVAATGKAYTSTLTVAELAETTPPALLVEHEFHDWTGSASTGGADWIRDARNRAAIAKAYRAWVVALWGAAETAPVEKVRMASYNLQAKRWGGGSYTADAEFIRGTLKPSLLATQETDEDARSAIRQATGFLVGANNLCAVFWDGSKYQHGGVVAEVDLGTAYHGLIATELTSRKSGQKFVLASCHVRPSAAFPSSWSKSRKVQAKLDDLRAILSKLEKFPKVVLGGDFNTREARKVMEEHGYRLATPWAATTDAGDFLDGVYVRGLEVRDGSIHATAASDHHGLLANLSLVA